MQKQKCLKLKTLGVMITQIDSDYIGIKAAHITFTKKR